MLRDQERFDLVAHFPSSEQAKAAANAVGGRVEEESGATFGAGSWIGLGVGILLGIAVGLFFYRGLLTIGFLRPSMAHSGFLATSLWAVILGASGWILGSAIHLFSSTPGTDRYELHITVVAEKLASLKKSLLARGATAISVKEHDIHLPVAQVS